MPLNIADRLADTARERPFQRAVVVPRGEDEHGRGVFAQVTFEGLDAEVDRLARGLASIGVQPGDRMALFVPPGVEFLALTFALFRAGATIVFIDPGMGRGNLVSCLEEADPAGFVAVPRAHAARLRYRKKFPQAKKNVCVGVTAPGFGVGYDKLLELGTAERPLPTMQGDDAAAVIFTSGSTGPPKGVEYTHAMFDAQWRLIRDEYGIKAGGVDLPAFPLFALFNVAMGVTTVVPEMDPTRPAEVDGGKIVRLMRDQGVTQAFGSPAFWNRVGRHCEATGATMPSLRLALSAGAPVPVPVLRRVTAAMPEGATFATPYGATESLPACTITAAEVLSETAAKTAAGAGTCVGHPFGGVEVKVVRRPGRPVTKMIELEDAAAGEVGEILVSGPSVTRRYFGRTLATAVSKVEDGERFWHRIGDVGYFDESGRLWFCGREGHIVETAARPLYPARCEPVFNEHPEVYRSALVGLGRAGAKTPVLVVEPEAGRFPKTTAVRTRIVRELTELGAANEMTAGVRRFAFRKALPVDTRHNVKVDRPGLADWVAGQETYSSPEPKPV